MNCVNDLTLEDVGSGDTFKGVSLMRGSDAEVEVARVRDEVDSPLLP